MASRAQACHEALRSEVKKTEGSTIAMKSRASAASYVDRRSSTAKRKSKALRGKATGSGCNRWLKSRFGGKEKL